MTPAEQIRKLLAEAYYLAKEATNRCFDDTHRGKSADKRAVFANTYACISKYSAAAAIYWANPELEDPNFIKLLQHFDYVSGELKGYDSANKNNTSILLTLMELEDMLDG